MERDGGDLRRDSIAIDGLNCSNWESPEVFESLARSGLSAINATIAFWENYRETLDNISRWLARFDRSPGLLPIHRVEDVQRAKAEGRVGIILGWQNASPIESDLGRLRLFHALGVRIVQLTYNARNLLGNGCAEAVDDGLSRFGSQAVREMNQLGILIDLSHVGDRSTLQAIELSERPVSITHANARSLVDHRRNKSDDAIRLLAERGGVIGANAFPRFLPRGFDSTLEDYLDAIESLIELAGVDHVAIGTDFTQGQTRDFFDWIHSPDGTTRAAPYELPDPECHPKGLERPDQFYSIAAGLLDRGYASEDVKKIIGENWLRLFGQVWT